MTHLKTYGRVKLYFKCGADRQFPRRAEFNIHQLDRSCKILRPLHSHQATKEIYFPNSRRRPLCALFRMFIEYRHYSYNCPEQASFALLLVKLTVLMSSECCPSRINVFSSGTLIIYLLFNS